ncbi:MAG: S8 family serine peptidase, partial [Candidatus Omnitrophica bacterium]|nr:S8 family serine peptidase [Candidatus Omnitrophota bacterium]
MNIKKSSIVLSSIVISFIAVTSLSSNVTPAYSEESSFSVPKAVNSRMSSALDNLIYKKTAAGALKTGVISGMPARTTNLEQKKTRVILETRDNDVDLKEITSRGGEIVAERRGLVAVEMPLDKIEDVVNNVAGIEYARLPRKFFRCGVTSEGVSLTLASNLHSAGFTGQGVKIAIIDLGFNGLSAAQANGDLPYSAITRDYTGTGLTTKYKHGTACAEIVYDMAPGAELHLLKVSDEADIYNALDYCIASGIEIISASIGTYGTGPGNGTGSFDEVCDEARLAGILIVSAAGNDGNTYSIDGYPIGTHWEGVFIDSNYNNIHEFLPGYEYNVVAGFPVQDEEGGSLDDDVEVMMRWDDWPNAATDYDMYLYDYSTSALVASSTDIQNGSQPPIECMSVNLPDT